MITSKLSSDFLGDLIIIFLVHFISRLLVDFSRPLFNVTIKTTISPLFICQIPSVNSTEVGSNTVRNVKQRILLVDLAEMGLL